MQHIKLKFQIDLINEMFLNKGMSIELYYIMIKFLDKDESFEIDFKNKNTISYNCKNGFRIISDWNEPFGFITDNGLLLPKLDKIGFELKKTFSSDNDRYSYVKILYQSLNDWANNWEGFYYDAESVVEMKNNIWTVGCPRRVHEQFKKIYKNLLKPMKIYE